MNIPIQKTIGVILALFFLSGSAVFVRDGDYHHHRGYWRRYSSIQQPNSSVIQMTAQNGGEMHGYNQVSR